MPLHAVTLYTIAHGRSGDKGDAVNVGIIARHPKFYPFLKREITAERVGKFLAGMGKGPVERYELDNLEALNFIVNGALGGGGSIGMQADAQGKTYASAALRMTVQLDDEQLALARECWGGTLPDECWQTIDAGYRTILAETVAGRILHIRLNRPESRNALTLEILEEVARALEPCDRRKAVVISGEGAGFCAGMDLREMLSYNASYARFSALGEALYTVLARMIEQPCPVIAAVHGMALGGGSAIALASDMVVADASAKFGFPETKIGFIPGLVSSLALRRMPALAARELLLTGRTFDADEATRLGMVSYRVAADPAAKALDVAKDMLKNNSGIALRYSKNLLNINNDSDLIRDLRAAVNLFAGRAIEPAFQHAMASFAAKKPVDWTEE